MAYKDPNAADALGAGGDAESPAEDAPEAPGAEGAEQGSGGKTFFLPKDVCEGMTYKPGDSLSLEVVGTDQDGDLEVKMAGQEGEDWRTDLRGKLAQQDGGDQNG